jgi:hypothetical protein
VNVGDVRLDQRPVDRRHCTISPWATS